MSHTRSRSWATDLSVVVVAVLALSRCEHSDFERRCRCAVGRQCRLVGRCVGLGVGCRLAGLRLALLLLAREVAQRELLAGVDVGLRLVDDGRGGNRVRHGEGGGWVVSGGGKSAVEARD